MDCTSCGFGLPPNSHSCPYCGALAPPEDGPTLDEAPSPAVPTPPPAEAPPRWPTEPINLETARSPTEKTAALALTCVAGLGGLYVLVLVLASLGLLLIVIAALLAALLVAELFLHAYIKTNGVRLSPSQYPDLHETTLNFCERMGVQVPEVYVMQHCVWNAFAARFAGKGVVVLLSGAVDSILEGGRREDLGFLIGHELAHHALNHLDWKHRLLILGQWVAPWVGFWHRRHQELSCDRVALACTGDLPLCLRAVTNMTVGARLAAETNVDEAIDQWERHKGEAVVLLRTLYSPYPHHLWRMASLRTAAREWGLTP